MKFVLSLTILLTIVFCVVFAINPVKDLQPKIRKCDHQKRNFKKTFTSSKGVKNTPSFRRQMSNEVTFKNMRIHFDYTNTLDHERVLLQKLVMPSVQNFFEKTLSVRRASGKLRFPRNMNTCSDTYVPDHLKDEGVDADLIIMVSTWKGLIVQKRAIEAQKAEKAHRQRNEMRKFFLKNNKAFKILKRKPKHQDSDDSDISDNSTDTSDDSSDTSKPTNSTSTHNITSAANTTNTAESSIVFPEPPEGVVGYSTHCLQDIYTMRPVAGSMTYVADILPNQRNIEEAIWTTLHEISHILAMDYDLYTDFVDKEFNMLKLKNVIKIKSRLKGFEKLIKDGKDYLGDADKFIAFCQSKNNTKEHPKNYYNSQDRRQSFIQKEEQDIKIKLEKSNNLNKKSNNQRILKANIIKNKKAEVEDVANNSGFININPHNTNNSNIYRPSKPNNTTKTPILAHNTTHNQTPFNPHTHGVHTPNNTNSTTTTITTIHSNNTNNTVPSVTSGHIKPNTTSSNSTSHGVHVPNNTNINNTFVNNTSHGVHAPNNHTNTTPTPPPTVYLETLDDFVDIDFPENIDFTVLISSINNLLENTKILIITPKVVEMGRKHFGCDKLDGVELEHLGGMGSAFSHWGKKAMNTEFMIADSYGENYISSITLGLFEDSGWYKIDYTKAQVLPWGHKKGCGFLNDKCIERTQTKNFLGKPGNIEYSSKYNEYCTNFDEVGCSISHIFRGICKVEKYDFLLPTNFQYFEEGSYGGLSSFGDFCTYPLEWTDESNPVGSCRNGKNYFEGLGEKVCENCRCFKSSLVAQKLNIGGKHKKNRAACYETRCRNDKDKGQQIIVVINNEEIVCPKAGAILTVDGYDGAIECPLADVVCTGPLDVNNDYSSSSGYSLFNNICTGLVSALSDIIASFVSKFKA